MPKTKLGKISLYLMIIPFVFFILYNTEGYFWPNPSIVMVTILQAIYFITLITFPISVILGWISIIIKKERSPIVILICIIGLISIVLLTVIIFSPARTN